jgi:hypothetical protein
MIEQHFAVISGREHAILKWLPCWVVSIYLRKCGITNLATPNNQAARDFLKLLTPQKVK